jgi:hypothetical protein
MSAAISAPPEAVEVIGLQLPDQLKWRTFFSRKAKNPKYLRRSDDGYGGADAVSRPARC